MDFIKTSSLRALIELTFQRNWNGLIWMSRKGVTTKRVETVQTALSRKQRPTAQSGWPRNACSALGQNCVRPSEVSAKVQNHSADHASRPGKLKPAVGHATTAYATPRTIMPRKPGSNASRPRNSSHVLGHDPTVRPIIPRPSRSPFEARFHIFKARLNPKPPQKT
ncbi:unnamed protein product [Microthlaspi erraticum]|uniref:Uncharacterized protein n=1 Tax=Microthlaspi erraticum TaxID=1685480 RepID=A0A6D2JJV2_9BRAS|nr:unnamed protein product [Microthlaspi erraticum]